MGLSCSIEEPEYIEKERLTERTIQLVDLLPKINYYDKLPRVAIVGNINSGKTSLINSLVNTEILPTSCVRETLVPVNICHHIRYTQTTLELIINTTFCFPVDLFDVESYLLEDSKIKYVSTNCTEFRAILSTINKLFRTISQTKYGDIVINIKTCIQSFIEVGIENIIITDTPGYNEVVKSDYIKEVVRAYIERSQIIFFVMDYCQIASEETTVMHEMVSVLNKNVYYVLNKVDIPLRQLVGTISDEILMEKRAILLSKVHRELTSFIGTYCEDRIVLTHSMISQYTYDKGPFSILLNNIDNFKFNIRKLVNCIFLDIFKPYTNAHVLPCSLSRLLFNPTLSIGDNPHGTITIFTHDIYNKLNRRSDYANYDITKITDSMKKFIGIKVQYIYDTYINFNAYKEIISKYDNTRIDTLKVITEPNYVIFHGTIKKNLHYGPGSYFYPDGSVFVHVCKQGEVNVLDPSGNII